MEIKIDCFIVLRVVFIQLLHLSVTTMLFSASFIALFRI